MMQEWVNLKSKLEILGNDQINSLKLKTYKWGKCQSEVLWRKD